jgi:hypothetical protein
MRSLLAKRTSWLFELAGGWVYWLAFLLLLEAGNILAAWQEGQRLSLIGESGRILGAGLLGALSAPPLLAMIRRFPLEGVVKWRHALLQVTIAAATSVLLLLIGVLLGSLAGIPQRSTIGAEFSANGGLLFYCTLTFIAGGNVLRFLRAARTPEIYPHCVPVKDGYGVKIIDLAMVDWIESQGNYIALHQDGRQSLVRETLSAFEKKLDPALFRRIHRSALVRLDRISEIAPMANGDQALTLITGEQLRVSRTYRDNLLAALPLLGFDRKQRSATMFGGT